MSLQIGKNVNAGAAEQALRTRGMMPSGPVAKSDLRVERTFSTFSGAKRHRIQEQFSMTVKDRNRE